MKHDVENNCSAPPFGRTGVVKLTPAEAEVVAHLTQGLTNREIAVRLGKSEGTIKNQLRSVYSKLGVKNRIRLMVMLRP
jgi:DNA-binding NarL/FixJ family response regulator